MKKTLKTKFLFVLMFALVFAAYQDAPAQRKGKNTKPAMTAQTKAAAATNINYTVSMPKPWTHLLEVEMRLKGANMPATAEIKMPVWTPGSYLIREYARHVEDFEAKDANGNPLMWQKVNKNTWQINTKKANEIVVNYKVYANELTVRTNELNDEHAFFTPAALLMFPKGMLNAPSTVKVVPYGSWKVATGLPEVPMTAEEIAAQPANIKTKTFYAENFDILYDSPFEVSNFKEINFDVRGIPHRYVVTGEGNYNLERMATDTKKIIEETAKIFGELPYKDYTFILNTRGGGGLEHLNSTALQWDKFGFAPESRYNAFLSLVAHEFFHLYNVKRIRPDALGPFDYENENYTRLLWVAEGATSYYEGVLMKRAGIVKDDYIFNQEASVIEGLQRQPGRFETSLEDASFDAWIKYYRRDENAVNNQISYYSKGELVNFLLDARIRAASGGAKSLDDVMRYLYTEFYKKGKNYTPADYQKISEMMAGKSLEEFFSKYVRGTAEIEYDEVLRDMGLRVVRNRAESEAAYLGANLTEANGGLRITSLPSDTPAYIWGLNTDDQIVAVDGYQVSNSRFLDFYLDQKKAGDKVKLTLFRFGKLRDVQVTLGKTPAAGYAIVPVENPSEEQKRLLSSYPKTTLK